VVILATTTRISIREIAELRLQESLRELDLAEAFLRDDLIRYAAGKVFQAWKSLMSYLAVQNIDLLENKYKGIKRIRKRSIPLHEWVAAIMPTNRMTEVATILSQKISGVVELTSLALQLHEYQYNGPDPEDIRSKIPNDETARELIKTLVARTREIIRSFKH
jgi:hypothetical protein